MIKSFQDKEAEKLFCRFPVRKIPSAIQRVALRKLLMVDAAVDINDLRVPPGNHLEKLSGDRKGQYSIKINDQWRVCFLWESGGAHQVEICDYHS